MSDVWVLVSLIDTLSSWLVLLDPSLLGVVSAIFGSSCWSARREQGLPSPLSDSGLTGTDAAAVSI